MEKRYGATERRDVLMQTGRKKWDLMYGYGTDGMTGWNWYERFDHEPSADEIREVVTAQINRNAALRIREGLTWRGKRVYLSMENQMNFKMANDVLMQGDGGHLPMRFKLGEDDEGCPQYHAFETAEEWADFYGCVARHVKMCLDAAWAEKDGVDWSAFAI